MPPPILPAGAQGGTSACRSGAALSFVSCIALLDRAPRSSEELPELLNRQTGIDDDTAHRERVDWIVTGNGEDASSIRHDDVSASRTILKPAFSSARTA